MTSTVKVSAHCGPNKRVEVNLIHGEGHEKEILQDGQEKEFTFYDNRTVTVHEVDIPQAADSASGEQN